MNKLLNSVSILGLLWAAPVFAQQQQGLNSPAALSCNGCTLSNPIITGLANFTGTFKIGGVLQTFPGSGLIVGTTDTQTLTNKILTSPSISSPTITGTIAGSPTASGTWSFSGLISVGNQIATGSTPSIVGNPSNTIQIAGPAPGAPPLVQWYDIGASTDNQIYRMGASSGIFSFDLINTAYNSATHVLQATRSGMTLSSIALGGPTSVSASPVWSGGASPTNSPLYVTGVLSGTATSSSLPIFAQGYTAPINLISVTSDSIAASDTGLGGATTTVDGLTISHVFGGAGAKGSRSGISSNLILQSTTGNSSEPTYNAYYNGIISTVSSGVNDGGTGGTAIGNLYGNSVQASLKSGATFWAGIAGGEWDIGVQSGASVTNKNGLEIALSPFDAVHGSNIDAGILLDSQGTAGWTYGISFGTPNVSNFPMASAGTMLGSYLGGSTGSGVDFSNVTFSNYAFKSNGFSIDGSGNAITASSKTGNSYVSQGIDVGGLTANSGGVLVQNTISAAIASTGGIDYNGGEGAFRAISYGPSTSTYTPIHLDQFFSNGGGGRVSLAIDANSNTSLRGSLTLGTGTLTTSGDNLTINSAGGTTTLSDTHVAVSSLSASAPVVSTDSSKNLTTTSPTQSANTVYAGPTTGAAASPGFRTLVAADLPAGFTPVLTGTSGSIGGSALLAGACSVGTTSVTGATTSMVALADPNTYPGDGAYWDAYVSGANTVTVKVCATVALTPAASTYNVRIIQ